MRISSIWTIYPRNQARKSSLFTKANIYIPIMNACKTVDKIEPPFLFTVLAPCTKETVFYPTLCPVGSVIPGKAGMGRRLPLSHGEHHGPGGSRVTHLLLSSSSTSLHSLGKFLIMCALCLICSLPVLILIPLSAEVQSWGVAWLTTTYHILANYFAHKWNILPVLVQWWAGFAPIKLLSVPGTGKNVPLVNKGKISSLLPPLLTEPSFLDVFLVLGLLSKADSPLRPSFQWCLDGQSLDFHLPFAQQTVTPIIISSYSEAVSKSCPPFPTHWNQPHQRRIRTSASHLLQR